MADKDNGNDDNNNTGDQESTSLLVPSSSSSNPESSYQSSISPPPPPPSRPGNNARSAAGEDSSNRCSGRGGVVMNRVLILAVMALVVFLSIVFKMRLGDLNKQLSTERSKVHALEDVVADNARKIERFNASITNQDVQSKLLAVEEELERTSAALHEQLDGVRATVRRELNDTLETLNEEVAQAKLDIGDEVEKVKQDVEEYNRITQDQFSMENSFMVYQLAGTFTLLSCLISMWHMTAHLRKMNQPNVQRKILAILWMSPIYAVTSWFSLVFHSAEGWLAIIKDGWEAYIIYQFLSFCIAVLGKGDRNTVVDLLAHHAGHLTPPFRLFGCFEICGWCKRPPYENDRALASDILLQCQFFAMQFVFLRPLTTTAMVVLDRLQYYGAGTGPTDYRSPQFYVTIIQNISIFVAFTGLLKFYHAVTDELAWCRPLPKFLCIKGVVFMTFWQGLAISLLAQTTNIAGGARGTAEYAKEEEEWAKSAQNFLICLEMLLFSIAHFYCFPTDEWQEGYRVKHTQGKFGDSIALGDFFQDVKLILRSKSQRKKKKKPIQPAIPEGDEETAGTTEDDDDDDTASLGLSTTSNDELLNDEERARHAVAKALEESLGCAADDPDIREAKERLLASGLLSPQHFEPLSGEYDDGDRFGAKGKGTPNATPVAATDREKFDGRASKQTTANTPTRGSGSGVEGGMNGNDPGQNNSAAQEGSHQDPEAEVPTESTGLLSGQDDSLLTEKLRPSIFTMMNVTDTGTDKDDSAAAPEKKSF